MFAYHTWAGVAIRVGDSNISKYGGTSELTGRLRSLSGELAATEASFDKNGSLGLRELRVAQGLKRQRFIDCVEDEEEHAIEDAIGNRKGVAILDFTPSLD